MLPLDAAYCRSFISSEKLKFVAVSIHKLILFVLTCYRPLAMIRNQSPQIVLLGIVFLRSRRTSVGNMGGLNQVLSKPSISQFYAAANSVKSVRTFARYSLHATTRSTRHDLPEPGYLGGALSSGLRLFSNRNGHTSTELHAICGLIPAIFGVSH